MKAVFMAGGMGTRIASVASGLPKPMLPIDGKPVLEREMDCLKAQGITEYLVTVSRYGKAIEEYFGDGTRFGVKIRYYREKTPLGNAGALFQIRPWLDADFLLLNADLLFDVDFGRMLDFHRRKRALVTLLTHPNAHPYDSALVVADAQGVVTQWLSKENSRPDWYRNRVNAGLHILNPSALDLQAVSPDGGTLSDKAHGGTVSGNADGGGVSDTVDAYRKNAPRRVDLDRQILQPLAGTGKLYCYDSPEYVRDMGTPERYRAAVADFQSGRVRARNLRNPQRAIFLDRDGVLNRYAGFVRRPEELTLIDGVSEALRNINASGFLAVVVTNQPVIARGEVSAEGLDEIHRKLETLLGADGAYLDALYYCPHHPEGGYAGEIAALKVDCDCRKPKPGMLLQAARDYNVNLAESFMIGDAESDIKAGRAAGCRTVLLNGDGTSGKEGDFGQDDTLQSLLEFAEKYLTR